MSLPIEPTARRCPQHAQLTDVDRRGRFAIASHAQFLLLGLGPGAIFAALGLGLLLTYRSSGVLNFAHGATAMFGTYAFVSLRTYGDLLLPLPGPPGRIHVGEPPLAVAAVVAVTQTALLSLAFYRLVFRRLRHDPPLAGVVASVGLMVALQALVTLQFGSDAIAVPPVLPRGTFSGHGIHLPQDRIYLAAIVIALAVVLSLLDRRSRFGLAGRAAAEDELALALLGYSPTAIASASWLLAGAVAGAAGVLVGPITAADPLSFSLLVVPALAAALVGDFASFGIVVAAAFGLGAAQSELLNLQAHADWLPAAGVGESLPLVVIVAVAVIRGSLLPRRTLRLDRRLPRVSRPVRAGVPVLVLAGGGTALLLASHGVYRLAIITSCIGACVCLSIVVLTGFLGQLSVAQMAFAGVAGFTLSRLQHDLGVPFPLDVMSSVLLAAVAGLLIGVPALRVRGPALAVATLAGGLAVEALVFEDPRLTGGFAGSTVRAPSIAGFSLGPGGGGSGYPRIWFGLLVLTVLCAAVGAVLMLRTSSAGRRILAVRSNERAAEAAGVPVTTTKLLTFVASAMLAGLAGDMLGWQQGQLSFGSFEVFVSLSYVAVTYVGGVGRIWGALVGGALIGNGIVFTMLDQTLGLGRYQLLVSGVAVVITVVLVPDGAVAGVSRLGRLVTGRPR